MDHLLHPRRRYRQWRERQQQKCFVKIEHPRMKIKGMIYWNSAVATNAPNQEYEAYLGIPYAAPPIGRLRFLPPQPLQKKSRVQDRKTIRAYNSFHPCLQYSHEGEIFGSEDCLYLNVYVPKKPEETKELLPVLVHIHGYGFGEGHSAIDLIQPDNMVQYDLVLVTLNFRLGPLGFLNMGTRECRGNVGLKDQVKALEWIRDNIENFKGDPNNVTIFGHSAGATCVNLHLISPLSKGLFHRAIVSSGGIHSPWGAKELKHIQEVRRRFECLVNPEEIGRDALIKLLKHMQPLELMEIASKIEFDKIRFEPTKFICLLGPSKEYIAEEAFLPSQPLEKLMEEATPVSVIAGITRLEGYKFFFDSVRRSWEENDYIRTIVEREYFTEFLQQNFGWSKETAREIGSDLRVTYFAGDEDSHLASRGFLGAQIGLSKLLTDLWFHRFYDNFKIGKEGPTSKPLYVYEFDYLSHFDNFRSNGKVDLILIGTPHGDLLDYTYNSENLKKRFNKVILPWETKHVIRNLTSLWANFCKDGIPRSEWEKVQWTPHAAENPSYLSIDQKLTVVQRRLKGDRWPNVRTMLSEPIIDLPIPEKLRRGWMTMDVLKQGI